MTVSRVCLAYFAAWPALLSMPWPALAAKWRVAVAQPASLQPELDQSRSCPTGRTSASGNASNLWADLTYRTFEGVTAWQTCLSAKAEAVQDCLPVRSRTAPAAWPPIPAACLSMPAAAHWAVEVPQNASGSCWPAAWPAACSPAPACSPPALAACPPAAASAWFVEASDGRLEQALAGCCRAAGCLTPLHWPAGIISTIYVNMSKPSGLGLPQEQDPSFSQAPPLVGLAP